MTEPIGPGAFVAVVGASGVGKDALLSYAREHSGALARFPRRAITRPPGPGEDHDPVTEDQFARARDHGAFALCWHAHGLWYGIPASVDAEVRDGRVVVANVSRGVIGELDARYRRLVVVRVTVPEEVRAQRLRARNRETEPGIGQRLARPDPAPGHRVDALIENDGSLAEGGAGCCASSATRRAAHGANHQDCVMTAHQAGGEVQDHLTNPGGSMPNDFAIDVTRLRDEARQHLKQGPVTPSNTTDVDRVVTVLNQVVATEMVCYLRYTQNAIVAQGIDREQVASMFRITRPRNSGTSSASRTASTSWADHRT